MFPEDFGTTVLSEGSMLQRPSSTFSLEEEGWFGLEVGIYILLPLLVLTVFGTVNYCKVGVGNHVPLSQIGGLN